MDRDTQGDGPPSGIPLDEWGPSDDVRAWAEAETPELDVKAEAALFRDYAKAEGKAIHDPDAAFRVWLRRGQKHLKAEALKGDAVLDIPVWMRANADPASMDDAAWSAVIASYRKLDVWNPRYGPKPGQPGCKVPAHLLQPEAAA